MLGLLSFTACMDDFTIGSVDGAVGDALESDAAPDAAGADVALMDGALVDGALVDGGTDGSPLMDVTHSDGAINSVCAAPWLYYVVQSNAPTYVARYSITAGGTERCADLTGGGAIDERTSSALVMDAGTMILAGPNTLQRLNTATDRIEWTMPMDLEFTALGATALFYVGATSFGVGWDNESPHLAGVSIRSVTDGAIQRELNVRWVDATEAPERSGDLWIVGRSSAGANVAQRYVVGSQSAIDEFDVTASRISTVGDRLVITSSAGYRFYDLEAGAANFVDTVVLPSGECRVNDTVGHPFRDAVFVGCGAGGVIDSVRIHDRDAGSYEPVTNSVLFDESVSSLSLYEGP